MGHTVQSNTRTHTHALCSTSILKALGSGGGEVATQRSYTPGKQIKYSEFSPDSPF